MQRWNNSGSSYMTHDQATEPVFHPITAPLPVNYFPQPSRWRRFFSGLGHFCVILVRKVNQILGFALLLLILLLLTRFLLRLFNVNTDVNMFTQAVFLCSAPLIVPFDHLFPLMAYQGYTIDVTTAVSMGIYCISTMLVRRFLKLLVTTPK